jgi:hypothetical protein
MRPGSEMPPACEAMSSAVVNMYLVCSTQGRENERVGGGWTMWFTERLFAGVFMDLQEVAYVKPN